MHCSSFQAVALPHGEQKMPTKDSLVYLGNTRASLPLLLQPLPRRAARGGCECVFDVSGRVSTNADDCS